MVSDPDYYTNSKETHWAMKLRAEGGDIQGAIAEGEKRLQEVENAGNYDNFTCHDVARFYIQLAFAQRNPEKEESLYKALQHVKKGISYFPEDSYLLQTAGEVSFLLKEYKEAEQYFKKILQLHRKHPNDRQYDGIGFALTKLSECELVQGNFVGADATAQLLLELDDPKDILIGHSQAAQACLGMNRPEEALLHAEALMDMNNEPRDIYIGHTFAARAYLQLQKFDDALPHARKLCASSNINDQIIGNTLSSRIYFRIDDLNKAQIHAQKVIGSGQHQAVAAGHGLMFNILLKHGNPAGAKDELRIAEKMMPNFPRIPTYKARLAIAEKRWPDACRVLTDQMKSHGFDIGNAHMLRYAAHMAGHPEEYNALVSSMTEQQRWHDARNEVPPLTGHVSEADEAHMLQKIWETTGRWKAVNIANIVEQQAPSISGRPPLPPGAGDRQPGATASKAFTRFS